MRRPPSTSLAHQVNVPKIVVFSTSATSSTTEPFELVELEVRELLTKHNFDGDNVTIVRGAALPAQENPDDPEKAKCINELMDAIDNDIPEPVREVDKPFLMAVEDVFSIEGRGTVATGRIERGMITTGTEVEILGLKETQKTVVTGVEMFKKTMDQGQAGDNVGLLLRGVKREEIERGQVIAKPGTITPHMEFEGDVYILSKDEGGRSTPFMTGYRPQFYFRTTDVTGTINLPEDVQMCMPGDHVKMTVELISPIAIEQNVRFAIRERQDCRFRRRYEDHRDLITLAARPVARLLLTNGFRES